MKERTVAPFKYTDGVRDCCLLPAGEIKPGTIQNMSKQALERNAHFKKLNAEKQGKAIQVLSVLGVYTASSCEGRWNRTRWGIEWENVSVEAESILTVGIENTTESIMRTGFRVLFHMLEIGVTTKKDLSRQYRINNNTNNTTGRVSHTRQSPKGPYFSSG